MKKIATIYIRKGLSPRRTIPMTKEELVAAITANEIPLDNGKTLMLHSDCQVVMELEDAPAEAEGEADAGELPAIEG